MTKPTEEEIEAGAQGIYEAYCTKHGLNDAPPWSKLGECDKVCDREDSRAALTAAAQVREREEQKDNLVQAQS